MCRCWVSPPAAIMRGRSGRRRGVPGRMPRWSAEIRAAHAALEGTYGAPRIHVDLAAKGIRVGRKRVARLMRSAGLAGVSRRKFVTTTVQGRRPSGARSRRPQLHGGKAEYAVGGRYHLHSDLGRLPLSGGRARCVQPSDRRLVDGDDPAHPAGARCLEHGARGSGDRRA